VSILGVTREGVILVVAQICITELQEKLGRPLVRRTTKNIF
jgi:hypothetical protein